MQKDYAPITAEVLENDRIEQFWTEQWRKYPPKDGSELDAYITSREEWRILRQALPSQPKQGQILDGGCGAGDWARYLVKNSYRVNAIDISASTIRLLNERFPGGPVWREGDIRALPFEDNSFDLYFSWGTFEHFEEGFTRCLEEALRVLKPGGSLVISVPFHNWRHWLLDKTKKGSGVGDIKPGEKLAFYQYRLTRRELRDQLRIHGLEPVHLQGIGKEAGAQRLAQVELGLKPGTFPYRLAWVAAKTLLPMGFLGHMLIAHARKPAT